MPKKPTPQLVLADMRAIGRQLTNSGIADEYREPVIRKLLGGATAVEPFHPVDAAVLHFSSYEDLYSDQLARGCYQLRLPDAGLIQMSYKFMGRDLCSQRLAYLPSPDLLPFQTDPDLYLGETAYLEVVGSQVMSVPVRFDFDDRVGVPTPGHAASHMTLGQYANCRIPISRPSLPSTFVEFIVRHFYSTPEMSIGIIGDRSMRAFAPSLTKEDGNGAHLLIPG
jgi:hypothetical protein